MGYYSNVTLTNDYVYEDHSYTPPEKVLLWRIEDLQGRLAEVSVKKRRCEDRITFSEDDLRYVLPEHFVTAGDVKAAIELAIADLKNKCGIDISENTNYKIRRD